MKKREKNKKVFLPGSTIGVLGSGQLGRMFTLAARRMGYRVHTYSPDVDTPTGQVADKEWTGSYENKNKLKAFASEVDVVTYEFENIPIETINFISKFVPTRPDGELLHIAQNRLREKTYLSKIGIPVAPFMAVKNEKDFNKAVRDIGFPFIIKTANFGYDGKGQAKISSERELESWVRASGSQELIVEKFIRFEKEISVVGARSIHGEFKHFGAIENQHRNHILDYSISPARVSKSVQNKAVKLTKSIMDAMNVVGVLCVEMFLTKTGGILINELAPRPHNSGHLTLDGFSTNQFEQQLRAVCGLPLAAIEQWSPCVMANLLGDLWKKEIPPPWEKVLASGKIKLHLYGKNKALPGRKMGHMTATGSTVEKAEQALKKARKALNK